MGKNKQGEKEEKRRHNGGRTLRLTTRTNGQNVISLLFLTGALVTNMGFDIVASRDDDGVRSVVASRALKHVDECCGTLDAITPATQILIKNSSSKKHVVKVRYATHIPCRQVLIETSFVFKQTTHIRNL